jgi:hypothetical protein
MTFDADHLYQLLPAIHRIRDAEVSGTGTRPLAALLAAFADELAILEDDLARLYDDQFVETATPWVLSYLGDLIGIRGLPDARLAPRAEVANTIGYRRRKGTAAMLEQLARDVTGWPARVAEMFQILATTQYLNHVRVENQSFLSVRGMTRLEHLGGPFERMAGERDLTHRPDVRRIASRRGRYNIPNVGVFLWRLRPHPLTRSPAVAVDTKRFLFHPLGAPVELFNLPVTEDEAAHLAEPANVPVRITARALARTLAGAELADHHYGATRSFSIATAGGATPVARGDLVACDLGDVGAGLWAHTPPPGKVAVDPVLGRVAFATAPVTPVVVTFHRGFAAELGGGEYERSHTFEDLSALGPVVRVGRGEAIATIAGGLAALGPDGGTVEITDSSRYDEAVVLPFKRRLELRAAEKCWPTLVLAAPLLVNLPADGQLTINGLVIARQPIRVTAAIERLTLRHTTLVPGRNVDGAGAPTSPGATSIEVAVRGVDLVIDHSILGALRIEVGGTAQIDDSIVDANAEVNAAFCAAAGIGLAGAALEVRNTTIIGQVHAEVIKLAENTIFLADEQPTLLPPVLPVRARRRQEGCMRFSYVPLGSRVPRQHECQPGADAQVDRVRPVLESMRWTDAAYCQLSTRSPEEICKGADDESEMGAFHDLYQPLREAHLATRLDEYLRFGLEVGIFHAT